jgi:hypothetical protein
MLILILKVKFIMNLIYLFFLQVKFCGNIVLGASNFISIVEKLIKFIVNLTFKIKINMRNNGHFGQLKIFSKTVFIFGWNVVRSIFIL